MQKEEGRLIVTVSKETDARAVIERAKQRFTSLIEAHDLGALNQVFLDFPGKDQNYIEVLKSNVDFPEVIGARWDKEIRIPKDDVSATEEAISHWMNPESHINHADATKFSAEVTPPPDAVTDPKTEHGTLTFNSPTRTEIATAIAQEGDSIPNLEQQVDPFAYGNVVPYTGSTSTPTYEGVVNNGSFGPKLGYYAGGLVYESYQIDYLVPGTVVYIWVRDASNLNYKWCFSTTPDGVHNGGVEYTTGVVRVGTPGSGNSGGNGNGAYIAIPITATTPLELYLYEDTTPGLGLSGSSLPSTTRSMKFTLFNKWYLQRISQYQDGLGYGLYSLTEDGENSDLYVIDTGVRGCSRPTGSAGANLHPELYHPDYASDLNGATEQANYRVYEVPGYNSGITLNGVANSNEDDSGHGTECAIFAAGRTFGVSKKSKIYSLKVFNELGSEYSTFSSRFAYAILAIVNHNNPAHANWKGNYRPAIVNASLGTTVPGPSYPYVPKNEPGFDTGLGSDTLFDDYENYLVANHIILVRSAGNGFYTIGGSSYEGYQGKFLPGVRSNGPKDNKWNMEIGQESLDGKITVGATSWANTFSAFSNYGTITTSAPGESVYVPQYYWNSNTVYNQVSSSYYACTDGTSFSGPIVAGILLQWATKMAYLQNYTYEGGQSLPKLAKAWLRRPLDWDYSRQYNGGNASPVSYEFGGGSVQTYPNNSLDEITLDGVNLTVAVGQASNVITFNLGSEFSRFNPVIGNLVQVRTPIGIISQDVISDVWVTSAGSPTAAYHKEGGLFNLVSDNHPAPGLYGTFPKAGTSGYVSNLTLSQQGSGYTVAPVVSFSGGGGVDAAASATITLTGGAVTGINIDQAGSGYTVAPTVVLTGDGVGATATATISLTGGGIQSVTVTNGGHGYNPLDLPTITFTGGGGLGASATAVVVDGVVTAVTINSPGSGYTVAPTVGIANASAPVNNPAHNPDNDFVSGGGSVTTGNLNTVSRALTQVADNLPQPALYGVFPNANNSYSILPKGYNHTITYRGGRNVTADTPTSTQGFAYDMLGLTKNGVSIRNWSHGSGVNLPSGYNCPTGYAFDKYTTRTAFGADEGTGIVNTDGAYYYITGDFLINTWKGSTTNYVVTVVNTAGGNRYYLDGNQTPNLILSEGNTYYFDQSDSTNTGYPFRLADSQDGIHIQGGSEYLTGIKYQGTPGDGQAGTGTYLQVQPEAANLYYYCSLYSGYGGAASVTTNTNSAALPSHTTSDIINATHHSPIVGYAMDGYPIYGPIGYDDPASNTTLARMISAYDVRSVRSGTPYTPVNYTWDVTASDSNDYLFTATGGSSNSGTDVSIAANVGDNLIFNVNASYVTGGGGGSTPQTYNLVVTASNSNDYTISGSDRNGNQNGADPGLTFYEGDTINFTVSASGHPFYLKTAAGTGTGNQVSGATNQGTQSGTVSWTPTTAGTYYYQCEYHGSMVGTITVSAPGGGGGTTVNHPFWIQKVPAPYNPAQVVATVTNNGNHNATVLWNTSTTYPGTYYYVCEAHQAMTGTITLTEPVGYAPNTNTYPMGSFIQDYELKTGTNTAGESIHLDRRNGRFCITPDFPGGTYAYFMTFNSSATPVFPYVIGDYFYGDPVAYGGSASANPVFEEPAAAGCDIGTQTGVLDAITIDVPGVGYTTCTVSFTGGGGGAGAQASATLSVLDGYISALNVTTPGTGYSTAPTVSIAAPNVAGGVQATAVASIAITAGNPNSIVDQSFDQDFNWRGGTDYGHSTTLPVAIPLRSVKPFGISTTGVYMYHYSNESGPTPGWTFNDVTNENLTGADTYGGYPNAANVYGYNSSKLLESYEDEAVRTGSTYIANSYFDLGYQTINWVVTVDVKTAGNNDFGSGSANGYFLRSAAGVTTEQPTLEFTKGNTYIFNQDDTSNDTHPLYFSSTDDGVHSGGVKYNDGVTYRLNGVSVDAVTYVSSFDVATTRSVTIIVPLDAPADLHYVCNNHSKMGDAITTNTNIQGDYRRHANGHSKILGIAFDGYPIYGPYGYQDETNSSSSVVRLKPGYMQKLVGRTPDGYLNRPSTVSYPYKSFNEDFEYAGNDNDGLETTYTVVVSAAVTSGSGNRYYISGTGLDGTVEKPSFNFRKGRKYIFNLSDASNDTHAMLFSVYGDGVSQGWHVSGQNAQDINAVYTAGVVYKLEDAVVDYAAYVAGFDAATLRSVEVTPAVDAPQALFYFCYNHANMGERLIVGDLDKRNGRYCKTPDYPNGTYAYFITEDDNGDPAFPYIAGDTFKSDPIFPGDTAYEGDSFVYDVGGVEFNALQYTWHPITDVDSANTSFQITPAEASFTAQSSEVGGNLLKVSNVTGTHQAMDGIWTWQQESANNKLWYQTEQQELAGEGEGTEILQLPVDRGTDHNHADEPVTRGAVTPYIDLLTTWYTPAGSLGTFNLGQAVNIQLGVSFLRTFAAETIVDRDYTLSSSASIATTGLTFDTETGILSGTLTNTETLNLTLSVEENISGQTQEYTIQLTNVTTNTSDVEMVYDATSKVVDYNTVYTVHGEPNDDVSWVNQNWYSRPLFYKSLSTMFTQTQFDNDKFEYVPFWQLYGDKGGGSQWYNLNELAAATSSGYEEGDWFENNVDNKNTHYAYVEKYEDVTGREMGFSHLVVNKWWKFANAFFRCKMRWRVTYDLVAVGADYQVQVNAGGSTVFEVPKGAFYRFNLSDSSWTGKTFEFRLGATASASTTNVRTYGTPGSAGAWAEVYIPESYSLASIWFGQSGGTTFASQHLDFTTTYNAIITSTVQLTVSNLPALPAQPALTMYSGANAITANLFTANTEYGGETHYPNTTPYLTADKDPKNGRFPVQLVCTDQNIEYIWFSKSFTYDTATGTKSFAWKTQYETYPDYVPLASNYYRSRVDARNDVTVDYSPTEGGNGVYVGNYISTTEEFPLRSMYGGYAVEVPIQNPSGLVPPLDNSGNVIRATDIPCNGIPSGVNEPYSFQLYLYNGSYSSLSNEISVIANPPQLGMWWYEYSNGWTGTLSNGYLRHVDGFVDTALTCGDYFGNILTRSFVIDVAGSPLSALPYIDINSLQIQDYYKGAQNFSVTNNQTQDVTVSYTIDAGTFTWRMRIINEFPYMETTDGGTRTIFTLNNATHANGPTVVNTGDFSTYTGQLAAATGLLRECPFRGDTSINMPVDFSVKNDIQPAIFPARGTQKVYTLWVELIGSPFTLTDLINLTAVADPCQDHTYDFAYTQNGACVTPSNDYFCNFIKPLRDRNHPEQPIIGMDGIAQVKVTDGITPRTLDFQVPAPWPILYSYLGDCNPTCS